MRIYALLLTLPVLTACNTLPRVERVEVPIATPCRVTLPIAPAQCIPRDTTRAEWLRCALYEAETSKGYQKELEAALTACTSN